MQDDLELLKAELAEAKEAKDKMKEEAGKMKEEAEKAKKAKSEIEATIVDLQAQLSQANESLAAEKSAKEKMAEEMKKTKEKAEMNQEELDKMKKEKMMQKRKAALVDAGIAASELDETAASFESLDDTVFETVVARLKSVSAKFKFPPSEKKEDEKPTGPEGDKVKPKKDAKATEEVDYNEVEAEVLDSAEATENQIPMGETAEEESLRSFASEWFSSKVLKSTARIK